MRLAALCVLILAPNNDDPFAMLSGSARPLLIVLVLVPIAVAALFFGNRQFKRMRGTASLRPQGRGGRVFGRARRDEAWRQQIARLEKRSPTPIADAKSGAVRVEGTIVGASGNLGGRKGAECVWRNRAGARPESAVAAELIVIADDTGRCGVEALETAFVIAPSEKHSQHHENTSLYIGDRVEVIGGFEPEAGEVDPAEPTEAVYGTLTARPGLQVRVIERPDKPTDDPPPSDAEAEAAS